MYDRVEETLSDEVLAKMHAPPKHDDPTIEPADLTKYDAFLMGIPTREYHNGSSRGA